MDPLLNRACHRHPTLLLEGHIPAHCGFNPSPGCQGERKTQAWGSPGWNYSSESPLWAQARVRGGSALSPWQSAVCSLLEYSWC